MKRGCRQDGCQACALGENVDCKDRGTYYKIWCDGVEAKGYPCFDIDYEGETLHSSDCRSKGDMSTRCSKSEHTRKTLFIYENIWEVQMWGDSSFEVKILGKYPGDQGLQQATVVKTI